nr:potassium channel family protein [uncultured Tateyamaria sp.]
MKIEQPSANPTGLGPLGLQRGHPRPCGRTELAGVQGLFRPYPEGQAPVWPDHPFPDVDAWRHRLGTTIQIWTWAAVFLLISDLPDLPTSFYFATVTYTTLGYGDIVLDEGARIVATFGAITGLLTFGISTAFIIGVLSRVLPASLGDY